MNKEKYFENCFTEVEEGKVNAEFNKATLTCFDSKNKKFSMDCEGNLVVNSLITREANSASTDFLSIYPIGSVYITVSEINPKNLFGGSWEQIQGRFLLACDGIYKCGAIGGEATHQLTIEEMPRHNHWTREIAPGLYAGWGNKHQDGWITQALNQSNGGTWDTDYSGNSEPHNNMPPYLAVYMWKRIA